VAVHCYDDSTINIVVPITITIIISFMTRSTKYGQFRDETFQVITDGAGTNKN